MPNIHHETHVYDSLLNLQSFAAVHTLVYIAECYLYMYMSMFIYIFIPKYVDYFATES